MRYRYVHLFPQVLPCASESASQRNHQRKYFVLSCRLCWIELEVGLSTECARAHARACNPECATSKRHLVHYGGDACTPVITGGLLCVDAALFTSRWRLSAKSPAGGVRGGFLMLGSPCVLPHHRFSSRCLVIVLASFQHAFPDHPLRPPTTPTPLNPHHCVQHKVTST